MARVDVMAIVSTAKGKLAGSLDATAPIIYIYIDIDMYIHACGEWLTPTVML